MIQSVGGLTVFLLSAFSGLASAPENARELATLRGHTNWVTGVFSPDGQRLVTGSLDTTAMVWDLKTGAVLLTVPAHNGGIWSVAYSPDGRQFLTGGGDGDNNGKLWDANTGTLVQTYPRRTGGADWLESGPLRRPIAGHGQRVEVVGFSPDGQRVLTGSHDGRVIVWDAVSGEPSLTLSPSSRSWTHAAAYSPDGGTIAIGSYDGKLALWDAQGGRERLALAGHTNAIESLAYFPDGGRIVTASYDKTARIWDTTLGRELLTVHGHQGPVTCVAVSPDGRRVVTGSVDRSVRVWDANTGQQLLLLEGHKDAIDAIAFSPDARRVATTSLDRTIKIWDVTPAAGTVVPGAGVAVRLESDYIPLAVRLEGDPANREIRSIRFAGKVPLEGDGEGEIWLDPRQAELNAFGDVAQCLRPEPAPVRAELRYTATGAGQTTNQDLATRESQASRSFRLYDLVFLSGGLGGGLQLVLGTATLGPHRFLVHGPAPRNQEGSAKTPGHIIPLHGDPAITSALPDAPLGRKLDLSGHYTAADGRIHRLAVQGTPGGAGSVVFDPNYITFDAFGEGVMSTDMGYQRHEITLQPAEGADPRGLGRRRYWAVSKDSRNTNRVAVVLGRTEIGPHRILLYRGDQVAFVVPAYLADRRRQEIAVAEFAVLSPDEQQAIAELRRTTGYGFQCQIENGQALSLSFTDGNGRLPLGSVGAPAASSVS